MINLQLHGSAAKYAQVDLPTGEIVWYKIKNNDEYSRIKFSGMIFRRFGKIIIFYRLGESVFIGSLRSAVEIPVNAQAKISKCFFGLGLIRCLEISNVNSRIFRMLCPLRIVFPPLWMDFTFHEKEDFDVCIYIKNVINDPSRRAILFRSIEWRREHGYL